MSVARGLWAPARLTPLGASWVPRVGGFVISVVTQRPPMRSENSHLPPSHASFRRRSRLR
jgi:hypothetical protein